MLRAVRFEYGLRIALVINSTHLSYCSVRSPAMAAEEIGGLYSL